MTDIPEGWREVKSVTHGVLVGTMLVSAMKGDSPEVKQYERRAWYEPWSEVVPTSHNRTKDVNA